MPAKTTIKPSDRFGKLVVINKSSHKNKFNHALWECCCDCGTTRYLTSQALQSGNTKSCGCNRVLSHVVHGMSFTSEYRVWRSIKERCFRPTNGNYIRYGARGITMCAQWVNDFSAFYAHVGARPSSRHSIERIDNNGNYEPGNVRWASSKEQSRNTSSNVCLTLGNETMTLIEWSERTGISHAALSKRLRNGWSTERTLTTPLTQSKSHPLSR